MPQYLLEYGYGKSRKIVCTQPRRLATFTISKRIAEEMNCSHSNLISNKYFGRANNLKKEDRRSKYRENKLLFMTDKNLLSEYKRDKMLNEYECVIIDEAHERTLFADILLGELKTLVNRRKETKNPLKLIIMSATIDKNKFSEYFNNCPVIEVPGQAFPVKIYYEPMQKDYVSQSINKAKSLISENLIDGDVIIFLPAIDEINRAVKEFNKYISSQKLDKRYLVFALHGRLEPEEQVKVFETYPNKHKIIFSSNVAETSVTINGARIIIDSGRTKERTFDQNRNISVFKIKLITQSSAIQRKGRAII